MTDLDHKKDEDNIFDFLTRRKFLSIITIFLLSLLLKAHKCLFAIGREEEKTPTRSQSLIKGKFKFFTQHQALVVQEVICLIIPTDDDPGAKEAGVIFKLDQVVANSDKLKELYTKGIEWLNYMSQKVSNKASFIDLNRSEKIKILKISDSSSPSHLYKVSPSLYVNTRIARRFFYTIKRQTFEIFYTSEVGWQVVGYQGPPQWKGHLDYHECV
jgi:hypothetical protein